MQKRIGIKIDKHGRFRGGQGIIRLSGNELRCLYPRLSHETLHVVLERLFSKEISGKLDMLLGFQTPTDENVHNFYPLFYPWEYIWEK